MANHSWDEGTDKLRSPGGRLRAIHRYVNYNEAQMFDAVPYGKDQTANDRPSRSTKAESPNLDQYLYTSRAQKPLAPEVSHETVTEGLDNYLYDSEADGGDKNERIIHTIPESPWGPQLVRRCARSEFIFPGSSWNDHDFQALPQVKSAESRLTSTTSQVKFSCVAAARQIQRDTSAVKPHHLSVYLAAEVSAQLTESTNFDKFWAAAGDMEEYIRRVIWPQIMRLDAARSRAGLGSQVVTLAKLVPPVHATKFNSRRFWGCSVYMALRFPPGSHPFTTPVVRNAIAQLRRCVVDGRDPWGVDIKNISTQMALAATWAGYHIAHHLITCNVYGMAEDKVQQQRQQLDNLVWMAARCNDLVRDLFKEAILEKGNISLDLTWDKMSEDMLHMQWDRFVGACHRVDYNSRSLPLPLCKPSAIVSEMESQLDPSELRWDVWDDVPAEYDEPLDVSKHAQVDYGIILSRKSAEKAAKINEWLLNFLRGVPQDDGDAGDDPCFHNLLSSINGVEENHGESGPESSGDTTLRREPPHSVADSLEFSECISTHSSPLDDNRTNIADLETRVTAMESILGSIGEQLQQGFKESREATEAIHRALEKRNEEETIRQLSSSLLKALEPALKQALDFTLRTRLEAASSEAAELTKEGRAKQTAEIAGLFQAQNLVAVESVRGIVENLAQKINDVKSMLPISADRSSDPWARPASSVSQFSQSRLVPLDEVLMNGAPTTKEQLPSTQKQAKMQASPGSGDARLPVARHVIPKGRGFSRRRSLGNPMAIADRDSLELVASGNLEAPFSKPGASHDEATENQPKKTKPSVPKPKERKSGNPRSVFSKRQAPDGGVHDNHPKRSKPDPF